MVYDVSLEEMEGSWIAHLPAYAGCFATAPTAEAAVSALPEGLADYQKWHRSHGDETFAAETAPQFVVVEQVREWPLPADPGYIVNAFFATDARQLTTPEVETVRLLLTWAYADLVQAGQGIDPELFTQFVEGEWNIFGILNHCSRAAWWYLTQFDQAPPEPAPTEWTARLSLAQNHLLHILAQLVGDTRLTFKQGEIWSARKVVRRSLWHVRDHTDHIYQFRRALGVD